jgi:hypothetical protein
MDSIGGVLLEPRNKPLNVLIKSVGNNVIVIAENTGAG